ncbi:MAG: BlaI/MecI/CopY family transcriptional regulator [Patescibacteria group bacterium]|nr:BlaI/MecI/CopY family transcriptional regulator [Patescibacteria group bacterium]MCL6096651.1 BlaI/MecI/CopY family transcriptional regulator [Patescibacteria group bacterium]
MKQKTLSDLEQEIMNFIWEQKECSVRDVLNFLNKDRKIAYTTVATIMHRLEKKGFILKREQEKAYIYKVKLNKKVYGKRIAESFIKKFVNSFGDVAISSFVEGIEDLPSDKKKYLLKLLQENEKHK